MIELRHVYKHYDHRAAVADVSLSFARGQIVLLQGANGAGKSTLLRCILGITAFEGEIRVAGLDPLTQGCDVRSLIGYMPQAGGLHPDLTVEQTLNLFADIRRAPRERTSGLIREAGLAERASTRVGDLSGGLRQRLGFAVALITNPRILVLDEPSASLDADSRRWLAARLRAMADEGRVVLVSTHGGEELSALADRRIVLEEGRIASDTLVGKADLMSHTGETPAVADDSCAPPRGTALPLIKKEIRDAVGNRWLIGYAVVLGALGLAATGTGLGSTSGLALQGFGRTTATLMNLCLMLAPLVAVLIGAGAVAGEAERGTLEHLLAQPLSRTKLLFAKYLGIFATLGAATVAGFVPAGLLIAFEAGPFILGHYAVFPAIASLAAAAMAGIGLLISVSSRSSAQAQGAAVFTWFGFVLLYDLVLMGTLAASGMPTEWLVGALVANPVDAARVLGILALEPDLYLLGPAGAYLAAHFSGAAATAVLLGTLTLWAIVPVVAALVRFNLPLESLRAGFYRRVRRGQTSHTGPARRHERPRSGHRLHGSRRYAGSTGR